MRKTIVAIVAFAFMVPVLFVSAQPASANKPIKTYAYLLSWDTSGVPDFLNDKVFKLPFKSIQQWGGDWVGTMVYDPCHAMFRVGTPTSMITVKCHGEFTGSVLGKSGTLTINGAITIARYDGSWTIDEGAISSGTGELANLRGHVGFHEGWTQWPGYDTWWVHFE